MPARAAAAACKASLPALALAGISAATAGGGGGGAAAVSARLLPAGCCCCCCCCCKRFSTCWSNSASRSRSLLIVDEPKTCEHQETPAHSTHCGDAARNKGHSCKQAFPIAAQALCMLCCKTAGGSGATLG
jgi:hypothetical protein